MSAKLTPWFPCGTKPAISGEYEVRLWDWTYKEYSSICRMGWNGSYWSYGGRQAGKDRPGYHQNDQWRGLAEPPK